MDLSLGAVMRLLLITNRTEFLKALGDALSLTHEVEYLPVFSRDQLLLEKNGLREMSAQELAMSNSIEVTNADSLEAACQANIKALPYKTFWGKDPDEIRTSAGRLY